MRPTGPQCIRLKPDHSIGARHGEVRYSYASSLAGAKEYAAVASAAAGELLSLFRAYLPESWRPLRIELDIETPRQAALFEDVFQCPVLFNAPAVTVVAEQRHLMAGSKRTSRPIVTLEDVAWDRPGGAPKSLLGVAVEQIRTQVLAGDVAIDDIARSIDTSVRTLQRELHNAGTDFRRLTTAVRVQRATELLHHTSGSVTDISAELGYSSSANFARAFRKATGLAPREFRAKKQPGG
ncbi:helix-turn-helix domain-containing protein [Xanthobacter sp. ZOL 2024]